jgi:RNA polymerase sigma factor (sigma-70 family)
MGTLKRHCLMYWRNSRRQIYSAVDLTVLEWLSEPVASSQERADMLCDLESLLERLPSRCRSLLRLRFRMGFEPTEIARRLGYRTSSIGKITHRCLAALSRELFAAGLTLEEPEDALRAAERG